MVLLFTFKFKDAFQKDQISFLFPFLRLLGFRKVPITVGRQINLAKEVSPVASEKLLKTFSYRGNEGRTCFYGVCYYCQPSDQACTDSDGFMEGAVILWLPNRQKFTLKKLRNPWRRTYKKNVPARFVKHSNLILRIVFNSNLLLGGNPK